eukprot:663514-Pyramimonas_sp.AAC.1
MRGGDTGDISWSMSSVQVFSIVLNLRRSRLRVSTLGTNPSGRKPSESTACACTRMKMSARVPTVNLRS